MPIAFSNLFISFFITLSLIPILKGFAVKMSYVDLPSPRKVHTRPVPKIGGVSMAIGILVPVLLLAPENPFLKSIIIGSAIIVVFGIVDDVKNLGYKVKFTGQLLAAMVVVLYGGLCIENLGNLLPIVDRIHPWLSVPLTLFVIIGVTNAINLSDGLDGLAGGISVFSFICIGYLAFQEENTIVLAMSMGVIGAVFGFLRYNTHPANIFMGDAGSQLLGFLAVTLSVGLTQVNTPVNRLFPMVILGIPILDTLTVMLSRILRGQSPFVADKTHFHHRLMHLGLSHREAVIAIYILQALLVIMAFYFRYYTEWTMFLVYMVTGTLIIAGFSYADRYHLRMMRLDLAGTFIRKKLKGIRDSKLLIRFSFAAVSQGLPLLMVVSALMSASVPGYFAVIAFCCGLSLAAVMMVKPQWTAVVLKWIIYLTVPFLMFVASTSPLYWIDDSLLQLYHLVLGMMVVFTVVILKLTRRQKGFKTTPTDYLILFLALVVPNILGGGQQDLHLSDITGKSLVFLFGYEVLIGEFRGDLKALSLKTILALMIVSFKWFL